MKGLSQREKDEVKREVRRVNQRLVCSVLAEFVFVSIRFCLFLKISIGFFIKDTYRVFGEKNSVFNFIFLNIVLM